MKLFLLLLIITIGFTSCTVYRGYYVFDLTEGERNLNDEELGELKYKTITLNNTSSFFIEDDIMKIEISALADKFNLKINNKSEKTIKVIWDNCVFVNPNGDNSKFMHDGIKYIDREKSQSPTLIIKKNSINDILLPTNNVYFTTGKYGGWKTKPLFGNTASLVSEEDLNNNSKSNLGKNFIIMLTFEYDSKNIEYTFNVNVNDFKMMK